MLQNTMNNLEALYQTHQGNVSDKWELFLHEYDRLFLTYREKPVHLLEIGVQNGGSLAIWGQYFTHAEKITGCDVNPDCQKIAYSDPKIKLIIGDATQEKTFQSIINESPFFDIIIDDGSHTSADIIKAFCHYFAVLKDDGVFIVEDLHCSYWQEYSGGLYNPLSSVAFFKALADVLNCEHWGDNAQSTDVLQCFFDEYDCSLSPDALQHLHSIEFINSMCVIRKRTPEHNILGPHCIAGQVELVVSGHLSLHGQCNSAPDQSGRAWTIAPDIDNKAYIDALVEKQAYIEEAEKMINEQKGNLKKLQAVLQHKESIIKSLESDLVIIKQSLSWKITSPLRLLSSMTQNMCDLIPQTESRKRVLVNGVKFGLFILGSLKNELNQRIKKLVRKSSLLSSSASIKQSVAVIYLARGTEETECHSIKRFIHSYKTFQSGHDHTLYVIFKGFQNGQDIENIKATIDVPFKDFVFEDKSYDIGAYVEASRLITEDRCIFMNTHSEICADQWVKKLIQPLEDRQIGLVGCTASYESMSILSPSFPKSPNPHIRSNAFAIDRKIFVELTQNESIQSKMDAWLFESGDNSLTHRVMRLNQKAVVVDYWGNVFCESEWPNSGVFRHLFRQNELITDNQCRFFKNESLFQKGKLSFFAWKTL